jgi:cytoskeleton protein RodZ
MPEANRKEAAAQGVATRERERREEGQDPSKAICFSLEQTKVSRKQSQPSGLAMFTVCEVLQRARLDQGIDLATVAARTKIKAKYLQAIEADDRKSLPGGFFYKSFVHQYAKLLGVDTEAIDAEIDRVLSPDASLPLPSAAKQTAVKLSSRSRTARKYVSYAAFVLILVACSGIDGWWHESRAVATEKIESRAPVVKNTTRRSAPSPASGRVSLASVSQVAARPAGAAPVAAAARQDEPAAPAGSRVELDLTATEETWLSVSSDGTPVFSGLLEANQTRTIAGKEFAKLRVGNAAGLEVRLNGKPLGPLGAHGQVRDLDFTSDKFQFVSPPNESE